MGGGNPRPRAGQTDSRSILIVVQLLESTGCQLLFPLGLGGSLLLCGRASSITRHPEACPAPTPRVAHCVRGPTLGAMLGQCRAQSGDGSQGTPKAGQGRGQGRVEKCQIVGRLKRGVKRFCKHGGWAQEHPRTLGLNKQGAGKRHARVGGTSRIGRPRPGGPHEKQPMYPIWAHSLTQGSGWRLESGVAKSGRLPGGLWGVPGKEKASRT